MSDDFERLDRALSQLAQILDVPGEDADGSAEPVWQKLDLLHRSMGADALTALLRRQGMGRSVIEEVLAVLERRHTAMS